MRHHRHRHRHHWRPWHDWGPEGPEDGPRERHFRRHGLRHYFGAHLHRRLFGWFGASIVMTAVSVAVISHLAGHPRPPTPRAWWLFFVPAMVLWGVSGRVARRLARPLYDLVKVTREIGAGNLAARASLDCGPIDEIGVLGRSINDMATRIEKQLADQKQLLAEVSHELRTPLARIRLIVEIARSGKLDVACRERLLPGVSMVARSASEGRLVSR